MWLASPLGCDNHAVVPTDLTADLDLKIHVFAFRPAPIALLVARWNAWTSITG
jgi:hypothetical protein